jgi:hypothetical protein
VAWLLTSRRHALNAGASRLDLISRAVDIEPYPSCGPLLRGSLLPALSRRSLLL